MKSKVKRIVALLCATVLVATTFFGHWYTRQAEAATDAEPVFPDGYEYLTIKDFKDADTSVALTPGTGTSTDYTRYNTTACDSFEKVLLSMKVTFAAGTSATRLEVGGIGKYSGLRIYPSDATGSQLRVRSCPLDGSGYYGQTDGYQTLDITTTEAGVEKFVGEEFILQLAFDFGETDSSTGKADLTLDVYINGNLAKSCSFTGCNMAKFGNYLNFVNGVNITYDNVLAPIEPVFPDGYEYLTIKDFKDAETSVVLTPGTGTSTGSTRYNTTACDSFEKVLLSMKVTFAAGKSSTRLEVGGIGKYSGLWVFPSDAEGTSLSVRSCPLDGNGYYGQTDGYQTLDITTTEAGVEKFVGEEFILQLAFDFGETDSSTGKADLTLDVYINGNLAKSCSFTGCNMAKFGNYLNFVNGVNITYDNVIVSTTPDTPDQSGDIDLNDYEEVTIKDFINASGKVMAEKAYMCLNPTSGTFDGFNLANHDSFNGKVLSMNVKFKEGGATTRIDVAGTTKWKGLQVYASRTGDKLTILSSMADAWGSYGMTDANQSFDIAVADAKDVSNFVNTQFLLQLTFKFGEEVSGKADLELGVFINGESCGSHTFTGCNMSVFGDYMGLYRQSDESTIIVGSVGKEFPTDPGIQPSGRYEKVTYTQFGIKDGEYTDVKGPLKDETSVAGHVLCGDIQLKITGAQYTQIVLGGKEEYAGWSGIRLLTNTSDYFNVMWYDDQANGNYVTQLTPSVARVDFNGEEFNLMMSTEIVEHDNDGNADDIKLGIWFNGVLYNNQYIYIDDKGNDLGNHFLVSSEQAFLNADPELSKLPNKNFDKVTFSDFGLESQVHTQAEGMLLSKATNHKVLDKVVFSGDFRLSDSGDYQIIYGGNDVFPYNGMRLIVYSTGNAQLGWFHRIDDQDVPQNVVSVKPSDVGLTSFTKETFNLKISTELVDNDGDGNKTDIKVGIWFNDVIYPINGNDYTIITDWGSYLGNSLNISVEKDKNVLIRNDAEYQANPYYFEDISTYRQSAGYTYPTLEGYVFAGWYADEAYTEYIGTDVTSGIAWAKFVEKDVLSVKPQVMLDKESNNVPTDKTNLRFVTTVDNLNYRRISFYIEKEGGKGRIDAATLEENPRLVYEKLYAIGSNSKIIEYKPSVFSWQSEYFKAFTVEEIPYNAYNTMWTVTPYWVTMDGTTVPGTVLETCVNDYEVPGTNTSKAVSIDFLGEDVMPITGFFGPYTVSDANDPMLIPDYISDTYFKAIADMGVNLIVSSNDDYKTLPNSIKKQLELGGKYGIGIFVKDSTILNQSETDMMAQIANYSSYKAFAGMHLVDEPGTSSYCSESDNGLVSDYKDEATNMNKNNIMFYGNMYPVLDAESAWWEGLFGAQGIDKTDKEAYKKYLNEYCSELNPKVLSYDYYPFSDTRMNANASGNDKYNLDLYFWNLSTIRNKAKETSKPFWAYVQAGSQWNDKEQNYPDSKTPYYPDKAQFNWSAHTALAFGAQGIQYFPLVQPKHFAQAGGSADAKMWDFERNGLIGAAGNKTEWYFYAQELNEHIAAIDNVLMNASSDKIIALGSTAQADTNGLTDVVTTTSYTNPVSNEGVIKKVTATGNALVGCFDYCGKTALYVVNYDFNSTGDVTLEFNGEKEITKIENAETTETTATSMTLNMEAGEGILLVIE